MINGRVELFGEMSDMIGYWEQKERGGEEPSEQGGSRRRSKRIDELCEIYEGGGDSDQYNHLEIGGGGGGIYYCYQIQKQKGVNRFQNWKFLCVKNPKPKHDHLPLERKG